jgi:hypothetical protein
MPDVIHFHDIHHVSLVFGNKLEISRPILEFAKELTSKSLQVKKVDDTLALQDFPGIASFGWCGL